MHAFGGLSATSQIDLTSSIRTAQTNLAARHMFYSVFRLCMIMKLNTFGFYTLVLITRKRNDGRVKFHSFLCMCDLKGNIYAFSINIYWFGIKGQLKNIYAHTNSIHTIYHIYNYMYKYTHADESYIQLYKYIFSLICLFIAFGL